LQDHVTKSADHLAVQLPSLRGTALISYGIHMI
jgi:hypothetical protein